MCNYLANEKKNSLLRMGLTPKTMSSRSDAYAAVRKVLEATPSSHHGYWWSADDLARILSTGGVENVNEEIISKALNHERRGTFQRDSNGLKHSVARGASTTDGGGEQRAYNHILGTQHVLIVFSLVTGKPLYMKHN
jgi:hypothetical protein